ncbi:MAG: OmpA family protein [Fusobacterium sp.]|nr:OmpA family protein [Fusobacterium sp.]
MERRFRKIEILLFLFIFSISAFSFQKLTTTQMRENSIRINALEIDKLDVELIPEKVTIVFDARALNFDFDKSVVKPEYFEILKNVIKFIEVYDYVVTIEGHTDSVGTNLYNIGLSERRAKAVREKLLEFGLEESRIKGIVGKGEEEPITPNRTKEERFQNRRVEFELVKRLNPNETFVVGGKNEE